MPDVLIVEDMANPRKAISILLKKHGFNVEEAVNGQMALEKLDKKIFDLVITDLKMEPVDGMQLLRETKKKHPKTEVIMLTAYGSIGNSVEAMRLGAFDYLTKPFKVDVLLKSARNALAKKRERDRKANSAEQPYEDIIGESDAVNQVLWLVSQVANTNCTVLVTGESGTGKELVARAIHVHSRRENKPLTVVNCAALTETLLESELFGHVKGAFTGAVKDRKGLFEEARGGTIFLDEIGDISPQVQRKLLRVLQEGEIRRLGDNTPITVDARIIAATNKNLETEVEKGQFREDLYYRLNVIPIHIPPLRERRGDIPLLAKHFVSKCAREMGKESPSISQDALETLTHYRWPGNVRELENLIERTIALSNKSVLEASDIKLSARTPKNRHLDPDQTLAEMEKTAILQALKTSEGNHRRAAERLGISVTTLWRKLKSYETEQTV
jgi:DNA-binding NtrC family response regulator